MDSLSRYLVFINLLFDFLACVVARLIKPQTQIFHSRIICTPPLIFKKTQEIICISLLLLLFLYNIVILRVSVFSLYLPHIMCAFAAPPLPLFPFFLTGFTGQRRGKCMNQSKVAHSQGEGKPESERNKGGEGVKKEKR